jgi:hypothetical protein
MRLRGVELDLAAGPVVRVLPADLGDSVPVAYVERQRLFRALEVKDGFMLLLSFRVFKHLKRRAFDRDYDRLAVQVACFQVLGRKYFTRLIGGLSPVAR